MIISNIFPMFQIAGYKQVEIALTGMNFPCKDACGSFIEIKYQKDKVPTGARFCCDAPKTPIISDPGTEVLMILQSGPTLDKANYTGFTLQHKVCKWLGFCSRFFESKLIVKKKNLAIK
jgi:hypothetical protein